MDGCDNEGLSSEEARIALNAITTEELRHIKNQPKFGLFSCIHDTFYQNSASPVSWLGLVLLSMEVVLLFGGYVAGDIYRETSLLAEGTICLALLILVVLVCIREEYFRRHELIKNIEDIFGSKASPLCGSYKFSLSLSIPSSPAVSLVWTYRDQTLVNLPWNLLVEGDVILLGPSAIAPAKVKELCPEGVSLHCPVVLDAGIIFNPPYLNDKATPVDDSIPVQSHPHPKRKFLVLEAPLRRSIRETADKGLNRPPSIMNVEMKQVLYLLKGSLFWIIAFTAIFVNFVRSKFIVEISLSSGDLLLVTTAYTLLPLLPHTFPLLWVFSSLFGSARIMALFDTSVKKRFSEEHEGILLGGVNIRETFRCFISTLLGSPCCLPRTTNLVYALGTTTVLCCVDKEGILCFPNPVPEKLFLFADHKIVSEKKGARRRHHSTSHFESTSGTGLQDDARHDALSERSLDVGEHTQSRGTEVLGISYDPEGMYGIQFDDVDWKAHMDALKPLGLNVLLNCPCLSPLRNVQYEELVEHLSLNANTCPLPNPRRCLCLLSKVIGFHDRVIDNFKRRQCITAFRAVRLGDESASVPNTFLSIIKEKQVPNFITSVVEDQRTGSLQLLSQGSAEMLLDASTDYWDGSKLNELTPNKRRAALNFFQRMNITGHCVAFGYKPVVKSESEIYGADLFLEYPATACFRNTASDVEERKERERSSSLGQSRSRKSSSPLSKDYSVRDLLERVPSVDDMATINRILSNQIFIGMATLQYVVKEDVVRLVEELDTAGIRFVHFSTENELRSRVFCERLGLETGWNCHISLGENIDVDIPDEESSVSEGDQHAHESEALLTDTRKASHRSLKRQSTVSMQSMASENQADDNDDRPNYDFFFMGNRAKLPRGIMNIRPHLESVDDVPLLVPLFTDCTPPATAEMISIMQDYGEVVCCVGSSLNMRNSDIYMQADVSIAVEPLHPQSCLRTGIDNFKCGSPCVSNAARATPTLPAPFDAADSPFSFSSVLNGIGCSLSCHRNDNFRIVAILCEARRITFGLRSCWTFLLASHLSLSAILLLSILFLLPYPLTGMQLFWLILVIIPLLSLSLVSTPADGQTMSSMTGKKHNHTKETAQLFALQFFGTFFVGSCFCCLVVFPWSYRSLCEQQTDADNCHYFLGRRHNSTSEWRGMGLASGRKALYLSQDLTLLSVALNLVALSACYVHRTNHLWQRSPLLNKPWTISTVLCLVLQIFYTMFSLVVSSRAYPDVSISLADVPLTTFLCILFFPALLVVSAELTKKRFMKSYVRFQKRERLKFDTKLGMNSPV